MFELETFGNGFSDNPGSFDCQLDISDHFKVANQIIACVFDKCINVSLVKR
jgi:hypothetical protein